ncbi:alcohol dehydrogenase catalytic domain-containing protein [Streptomyces lydicus]|uniref:alcohol dehydrogenase catalytic domain-containing protein n=1 Tax=Streptomyces lydicus TaxID=47763 RepID=UPI0037219504
MSTLPIRRRTKAGCASPRGPGVTGLAEGDHVVLSWNPDCGRCPACLAGREARSQAVATIVNTSADCSTA